jgi:ubiquinone/menaquinone biosynthesis C-methylase UbiE
MTSTINRFDNYIELYDKYRLSYNTKVLNDTIKYIKNPLKKTIAEIGSGTGILTRQLIKYNFKKIYAIEPNLGMHDYAIKKNTCKKIEYSNALSFDTKIPTSSIDIIFIGTAIHWFEPKKTLIEFKRILKKGGYLVNLSMGNVNDISKEIYNIQKSFKTRNLIKNTIDIRYEKGFVNYSNNYHVIIEKESIKLSENKFIGLELSQSISPVYVKNGDNKIYDSYVSELKTVFANSTISFKNTNMNSTKSKNKIILTNRTTALISNNLF